MLLATHESPSAATSRTETLADLVERLGGIPLGRILLDPPPGRATEEDVVRHKNCELLDGILVETGTGWGESLWGAFLTAVIDRYLVKNRIAVVAAADGLTRLRSGRVRIPDVGVYLLSRFPGGRAEAKAICDIPPDWAIEILSRSNTAREMQIKREQFFAAGTRRVWIVDPRRRTIEDWTSAVSMRLLGQKDVAELGEILPEFTLNIGDWFREMDAVLDSTTDAAGDA